MPYSAITYRLLISAPSDIPADDLAIATNTISRWNANSGQSYGATVVPLHWGLHSAARHGERPQASLNSQLVASTDILVALFWHRLGTETGEAESGTVEEIEEAHECGAYVGILRCTRDYPRDSLDTAQLNRLDSYIESVKPNSLVLEYGDDHTLASHVEGIVNQAVARDGAMAEAGRAQQGPSGAEVWPRVETSEQSDSDLRGRPTSKRRWQLVLANTGSEPALHVRYRLEPESEGDDLPLERDDDRELEALAPSSEARYQLFLHMGVAPQARCVVTWTDSRGEHENSATLRFF